jgi:hypothetical protein
MLWMTRLDGCYMYSPTGGERKSGQGLGDDQVSALPSVGRTGGGWSVEEERGDIPGQTTQHKQATRIERSGRDAAFICSPHTI